MLGHDMTASVPKLYVLPGSHPCAAVEEAMRRKAIDFKRVDLLPLVPHIVGPLRYGGSTVPGMRIGDRKILGSRNIMRALDEIAPEPPMLPAAGPERERVLEAERWGDEVFQSVPRRILDVGFLREPIAMESYAGDARLPLPAAMLRPGLPITAKLMARKNHATDESARADVEALSGQLEKIDGWIEEGLLGGEQPNAADLQIGSTIRGLMTIADLRPLIEGHPAEQLARYFPPMAGEIPSGTLPPEWFAARAS
jgi:glutathione S-transferase